MNQEVYEAGRDTPPSAKSGWPFGAEKDAAVRQHLTGRFGKLTAFTRSPAHAVHIGALASAASILPVKRCNAVWGDSAWC
jgi:hypothetical protein